jgi:hypothetical protein
MELEMYIADFIQVVYLRRYKGKRLLRNHAPSQVALPHQKQSESSTSSIDGVNQTV